MGLLDHKDFCTLLVAVDDHYLDKLCVTWPTWLLCHPEILNMRVLIMYDAAQVKDRDLRFASLASTWNEYKEYHGHGNVCHIQVIPWSMPEAESQREKMLTSLVHAAAHIETPWYLKLDADTFASEPKGFYYDKWFRGDPAFIGSPWGYTKPGSALETLNRWASEIVAFSDMPEVRGEILARGDDPVWKVKHPRMCSWVMFGNTAWTQQTLTYLDGLKLPFPSQDTYLSYVAARTGKHYVVDKFRQYGWDHARNFNTLKQACEECLAKYRNG